MFEIFKTNLENRWDAARIINLLADEYGNSEINFDLEDCDRILRIKGGSFCCQHVIWIVESEGFCCDLIL